MSPANLPGLTLPLDHLMGSGHRIRKNATFLVISLRLINSTGPKLHSLICVLLRLAQTSGLLRFLGTRKSSGARFDVR
jgi:hypothetical protein